MKNTFIFSFVILLLCITSSIQAAPISRTLPTKIPATVQKPAAEIPQPAAVDTLQQTFTVSNAATPAVITFGATSPGAVYVDLSWNGAPVLVTLQNSTTQQTIASISGNQPATRLTYSITPTDIQKGLFWKVSVSAQSPVSGTIRIISPKADQAVLAKALASQPIRPAIAAQVVDRPIAIANPIRQVGGASAPTQAPPVTPPPAAKIPVAIAAGAIKETLPIKGLNPYPDSGTGAIVDVSSWQPTGRAASGSELIIQGRGLIPNSLHAMIGGQQLQPTTQSANEIRFRIPPDFQTPGAKLAVYHTGGQVRILEQSYIVYNPNVTITSITPSTFKQGDTVTISGSSLHLMSMTESLSRSMIPFQTVPLLSSIQRDDINALIIGNKAVQALNMQTSSIGDKITFQAGDLLEWRPTCIYPGEGNCSTAASILSVLSATASMPSSHSGPTDFTSKAGKITGPTVTWMQGGPKLTKAYGYWFGKQEPFVIAPGTSAAAGIKASKGFLHVVVEGNNLQDMTCKIGTTQAQFSLTDTATYSKGYVFPSANSSGGQVCCTKNGATSCAPGSIQVIAPPTISRMPALPLALGVNHTIEGINLLPPASAQGLTYKFDIPNLLGASSGSGSINSGSNQVFELIEHTAQRIVFRVGDPSKAAVLPIGSGVGPLFSPPQPPLTNDTTPNQMYLWASYQGQANGLWSNYFYLRPWPAPGSAKLEATTNFGKVTAVTEANLGNYAGLPTVRMTIGQPATLSWDLSAATYDSAEISPEVGPLTTPTGSRAITPMINKSYIMTVKRGPIVSKRAIVIDPGSAPKFATLDCNGNQNRNGAYNYFISSASNPPNLFYAVTDGWSSVTITPGPVITRYRQSSDSWFSVNGRITVTPTTTTTYTGVVKNDFGEDTKSCTLNLTTNP
jgi:hypothetical protein